MIIRDRRLCDLPACVEVLAEVHSEDGYPSRWPPDPQAWLSPPTLLAAWVAADDGTVMGHVGLVADVADSSLGSVSRLFVRPTARGTGLGRALLKKVSAHAAGRDLRLVLDVVDDAVAAIALYERLDWHLVDRRLAGWTLSDGRRPLLRRYALR